MMIEWDLMGEEVGKMRGNRDENGNGGYVKRWVTEKLKNI